MPDGTRYLHCLFTSGGSEMKQCIGIIRRTLAERYDCCLFEELQYRKKVQGRRVALIVIPDFSGWNKNAFYSGSARNRRSLHKKRFISAE